MKRVVKKFLPFLFLFGVLSANEKSQPTIMESLKKNPSQFFQVDRVSRPKTQKKKETMKDVFLKSPYFYGSIVLLTFVLTNILMIQMLLKRVRKKESTKISLR